MQLARGHIWLLKSHPNFFIIYAGTLLFHLSQALFHLFASEEAFQSPALKYAMGLSPRLWGAGFAVIFLGLSYGLFADRWTIARASLAAGAFITFSRAIFIGAAVISGESQGLTGLPVWLLVATLHFTQTAEPPVNPTTAKR